MVKDQHRWTVLLRPTWKILLPTKYSLGSFWNSRRERQKIALASINAAGQGSLERSLPCGWEALTNCERWWSPARWSSNSEVCGNEGEVQGEVRSSLVAGGFEANGEYFHISRTYG